MAKAFNEGKVKPEKRTKDAATQASLKSFCDEILEPLYQEKKAA